MAMLAKFKAILIGTVLFIVALLAAFFKGRSSGKQEVQEEVQKTQNKAVEEVAEKRVESVKVVNRVQQKVVASSDEAVDKELNDKWTRG